MPDKNSNNKKLVADKMSEIDEHIEKRFDIRRRLGKGAYGIVWKAVDRKTKRVVAIKKIFDAFRNKIDSQRTFREIMFLQAFSDHPNIVKLFSIHRASNNRDIYLGFEYMETDLHNVIKKQNLLKDIHMRYIMYQLFKAIKYIHSGNVIHRDLKPSNILLNSACHCKIADFGLARSVSMSQESPSSDPRLTDYVATRWYRAPEILIANTRYTKGIDMWSLGCIFGEMLVAKPMFPGSSTVNQVEKILSILPSPTNDDISSITSGFGSSLLKNTSNIQRKTLSDILNDASEDALDLITNLLVLNPTKRLNACQCLKHRYVSRFHKPENEPSLSVDILPPLSDNVQLSIDDYRDKLYELMSEKPVVVKSSKSAPDTNHLNHTHPQTPPTKVITTQITTPIQTNLYSCHRTSSHRSNQSNQGSKSSNKNGKTTKVLNTDQQKNNNHKSQSFVNHEIQPNNISNTLHSNSNYGSHLNSYEFQQNFHGSQSNIHNSSQRIITTAPTYTKTYVKNCLIHKDRPIMQKVTASKKYSEMQGDTNKNKLHKKNISESLNNYYSKMGGTQSIVNCFGDNNGTVLSTEKFAKHTNSKSAMGVRKFSTNHNNIVNHFSTYNQNHGIISASALAEIKSTMR